MTTRRSWKHTESRIATALGGERVPVTGRAKDDAPDVRHAWLSIEAAAVANRGGAPTRATSTTLPGGGGTKVKKAA
jgi:hypothetical protein